MPLQTKKLKLMYNALQNDGFETQTYDEFQKYFTGKDHYANRKKVYDFLMENGASAENIGGTYEDFMSRLRTPQTVGAVPLTEDKKRQLQADMDLMQADMDLTMRQAELDMQDARERTKKPLNVRKMNLAGGNNAFDNSRVRERKKARYDGRDETVYLTESGNEYGSRAMADVEQSQLDEARFMRENKRAYLMREKERIEREMNQRRGEVKRAEEEEYKKIWDGPLKYLSSMPRGGGVGFNPSADNLGVWGDKKYKTLNAQLKQVEDALATLDEAEAGKKSDAWIADSSNAWERNAKKLAGFGGGAWRGLAHSVGKISTWDFGITDMETNKSVLDAANAVDKGTEATKEDQELLDLVAYKNMVEKESEPYLGYGYTAGSITGESLPFMLEMAINPASGVGKGAMKASMRGMLKKYGKEKLKSNFKKYLLAKAGARVAGDVAGAHAMALTTGQGRVIADTMRRLTGDVQYGVNDNGQIVYSGRKVDVDGLAEAYLKSFESQAIENHSEMLGEYFAPLLTRAGKAIGKPIGKGLEKLRLGGVNRFIEDVGASKTAKLIDDFSKKTQWNGSIGEYAEEVAGGIENAMIVGDQTLDTDEQTGVFNLEKNIETFLGVGLMGGFMFGAKLASYRGPKRGALQEMEAAGNRVDRALGGKMQARAQWGEWRSKLLLGNEEEKKNTLREIMDNEKLPIQFRNAVADFSRAAQKYEGLCRAEQSKRLEGTADPVGSSLDDAADAGYELNDPQEMTRTRLALENERERMAAYLGVEVDQVDATVGENLFDYVDDLRNRGVTGEELNRVMDYARARSRYEGMQMRLEDDTNTRIDNVHANMARYAHRENGTVQTGAVKTKDGSRPVWIVSGNLVFEGEGKDRGVNPVKSDESIFVIDAKTGQVEMHPATDFVSLGEPVSAEEVNAYYESSVREQMKKAFEANTHAELSEEKPAEDGELAPANETEGAAVEPAEGNATEPAKPAYEVGDVVTLETEDGPVSVEVQAVTADGVEVRTDEPWRGQVVQVIPTEEFEGMIKKPVVEAGVGEEESSAAESDHYTEGSPERVEAGDNLIVTDEEGNDRSLKVVRRVSMRPSEKGGLEPQEDANGKIVELVDDATGETVRMWDSELAERTKGYMRPQQGVMPSPKSTEGEGVEQAEQAAPAAEPAQPKRNEIPVDEKTGEPVYEAADPGAAWDALVEEAEGDEELAMETVNAMVRDMEEKVKKAKNAKLRAGATAHEKMEAQKERKRRIAEAEERLESWKRIAGVKAERAAAAEASVAESPAVESPVAESPAVESPVAESPAVESPVAESPAVESPAVVETPAAEEATPVQEGARGGVQVPHADSAGQEATQDSVTGAAPVAEQTGTTPKGVEAIPTRKNNKGEEEVLYHKVPVARTMADLYDGGMDQEEIDGFVEANSVEAAREVKRIEGKKPKMTTNKAKYMEAKRAWQAELDEAKEKEAYWKEVGKEVKRVTHRDEAPVSAEGRGHEAALGEDMPKDEPMDVYEVVASALGHGRIKITPESFRAETGYSVNDQKKYPGMVASAENGGVSVERAAEMLMEDADMAGFPSDDYTIRQAIIDVLQDGHPAGYISRRREEARRRAAERDEREREEYYQDRYGMNADDGMAYEETAVPNALNQYGSVSEDELAAQSAEAAEAERMKREEDEQGSRAEDGGQQMEGKEEGAGNEAASEVEEMPAAHEPAVDSSMPKTSFTQDEAADFVDKMEARAESVPEMELTIENWDSLFGEDGRVETPIGEVKMGENQFAKLMRQGRNGKLGMIKPTLESPDIIIEQASMAKEGDVTERPSSYLFIKAFTKPDGGRFYYFTSVSVSRDGKEVIISNQEKSRNKILRLMTEESVIWRTPNDAATSSAEKQGLDYAHPNNAEDETKGSGITPQSTSSAGKVTESQETEQGNEVASEVEEGGKQMEGEEKTNTFSLSEMDSGKGGRLYQDAAGNTNLVSIPNEVFEAMGMSPVPFSLTESMAEHVLKHKTELGLSSKEDAVRYVVAVMKNADHVRAGDKPGSFVFSVENGRRKVGKRAIAVQVDGSSGKFLGISTSGNERVSNLQKRPLLWEKGVNETSATGSAPANVTSETAEQNGGELDGNASNQSNDLSVGKVTESKETEQGKGENAGDVPASNYKRMHWDENNSLEELEARREYLRNFNRADLSPAYAEEQRALDELKERYPRDGEKSLEYVPYDEKAKVYSKYEPQIRKEVKEYEDELFELGSLVAKKERAAKAKLEGFREEQSAPGKAEQVEDSEAMITESKETEQVGARDKAEAAKSAALTLADVRELAKAAPSCELDRAGRERVFDFGEIEKEFGFDDSVLPSRRASVIESAVRAFADGEGERRSFEYFAQSYHREEFGPVIKDEELRRLYDLLSSRADRATSEQRAAEAKTEKYGEELMLERLRQIDGLTQEDIDRIYKELQALQLDMTDMNHAEETELYLTESHLVRGMIQGVAMMEHELGKVREERAHGGAQAVSEAEAGLRDALVDVARAAGVEVVTDSKEGQRVLDEVNGKARKMAFGEEYDYNQFPVGRVEPELLSRSVEIVPAERNHGFANYDEAKTWAKDHIVRTLTNEESGGKGRVKISGAAVGKYLSESAVAKSDNRDVHLAVLRVLPDVICKSIEVETTPDFKKDENGVRKAGNEINKDVLIHRCYGAVEIDGQVYRVKVTLKEYRDENEDNKAYSYEATKIELLAGTLANDRNSTTDPGTNSSLSAAKLLNGVMMSYDSSKNVLDESAKMSALVREHRVFHGSGAEFDAFDHSHMGEGEGARFFKTENGEAYGFTVGGKVYLDPKIATTETAVHELTHLWADMLRKENPKEWKHVVELMKGTPVWDEVKAKYPELKTEDEITDEVLAHYSGRRGAERLRAEQQRLAREEGVSMLDRASAVAAIERVKDALNSFWKKVADLLGIHFKSAEEVADAALADILNGRVKLTAAEGMKEDRKELVAVHNITKDKLKQAMELGGFPMPSIAITKAGVGHTSFGDISLVFDKESINPTDKRNKVYGEDAWTPVFPGVGYKLNDKKTAEIYRRANNVAREKDLPFYNPAMFHPDNYINKVGANGVTDLVEHFKNSYDAKQMYLAEMGNAVTEYVKREEEKYSPKHIRLYEKMLEEIGLERLQNESLEELRDEIKRLYKEYGDVDIDQKPQRVERAYLDGAKRKAVDYARYGNRNVVDDVFATQREIDGRIDQQQFEEWLGEMFSGIVEKKGVRNDKDAYTPSGNARKWEQLYDEITLDNVVAAMQKQAAKGGEGLFGRNIFGSAQAEYKSIDEIRKAAKERIRTINEEEYQTQRSAITDRLSAIEIPGSGSGFLGSMEMEQHIHDAVSKSHTAKGIHKYLKKFYPGITMETAEEIADIVQDIQHMSARYFEAKPYRAVGFDEVKLAVVPSDMDAALKERLEQMGIEVRTYASGDQAQRKRVVDEATEELRIRFQLVGEKGEKNMVSPLEMSEEEKHERGVQLVNAPAVDVASGQIVKTDKLSARKAAEQWWEESVGKSLYFETEVGQVEIDKSSIKDSLSHGYRQEKLDAIASLPEGFKNAVYIGSMDDFKRPGVVNHYFAYPINYGNQRRYVFCRAMADNNKNRLYVHEVFMGDSIKESDTLQTIASASLDGELHGGVALYKAILKNVLDAAKVVEEFENPNVQGQETDDASYREVEQSELLDELRKASKEGRTVRVYRTMQVIDGKLYSPMAKKVAGQETSEIKFRWEAAEEHPELARRGDGSKAMPNEDSFYITIDKGQGKGALTVAYNPYTHTSRTVLNDQFSSAFVRPNLVVVEVEVPESELEGLYKAEKAKDSVGEMSWHSGAVSGKLAELGNPRKVILSRYDRPVRILTKKEEAELIAKQLEGTGIAMPYNLVTPQVREELEKLGVKIDEKPSGSVSKNASFGKAEYVTDEQIEAMNGRLQANAVSSPEAMTEAARALSEQLGVPVEIVTDVDSITHPNEAVEVKRRRAKGWYDKRTGKVAIVVPNHLDVEDVAATVFHEVVAHRGLRELVGEQGYDEFLMEVFNHSKADVRERMMALAGKHGWDIPKAVDEYLGGLAERGFGDFSEAERGMWTWLKEKVLEAIDKFIGTLKLPKSVKLGDNELRYLLWRSHENLRAGREGMVKRAMDVAKRYELGLLENEAGERMIDGLETYRSAENRGNTRALPIRERAKAIAHLKPVLVERNEMSKEELRQIYNALPDAVKDGRSISFYHSAFKKIYKEKGLFKHVVPYLKDLLEGSVFAYSEGDNLGGMVRPDKTVHKEHPNVSAFDNYVGKIRLDGKDFYVRFTVQQSEGNNSGTHSFMVTEVDLYEKTANGLSLPITTRARGTTDGIVDAKLRQFFDEARREDKASEEEDLYRTAYHEAAARDAYERRVKSGLYQSREALQDSMLGLRTAMEEVLKAEGSGYSGRVEDIPGFENAYLGENRLSSVNQAEVDEFGRRLFKPLLEIAASFGSSKEARQALTDYMMAKHGLERNALMRERAKKKAMEELEGDALQKKLDSIEKRDFAGLTALTGKKKVVDAEQAARKMVADFEQASGQNGDPNRIDKLWKAVRGVTGATLKKMKDSGLITKEQFDEISGMYDFYIPLRGFDGQTAEDVYDYLGHGGNGSAFTSPIKKAEGRKSKADDPFAYMAAMAESAIMQGNRNVLVKQKFLNFVLNHPSDLVSVSDLWLRYDAAAGEWRVAQSGDIVGTEKLEEGDSPEEVERKMAVFEERMQAEAEAHPKEYKRQKEHPEIPYRVVEKQDLREHQVIVKRNGRDYVLTINGSPRAAQALNGLTNPNLDVSGVAGTLMNGVRNTTNYLSQVYTTRNPNFVGSNWVRDAVYSNIMAGLKEDKKYGLEFSKAWLEANPRSMKKLYSLYEHGELDMNNEKQRLFAEFMANGGETGYMSSRQIEERKNEIERQLKLYDGKMPLRKGWRYFWDKVDYANRVVENQSRFAAYMASRRSGRTIDRSIYDAKEITVNFNKKGAGSTFYNAKNQTLAGKVAGGVSGIGRFGFAFWNAAIQGTTNFARFVKRNPKKGVAVSLATMALGYVVPLLASIFHDDDDDKEGSGYFDLPDAVRRDNFVFRFPGMDSWITIPLPVEYRALYGLGELTATAMYRASIGMPMTAGEIAGQAMGQISQLMPLDLSEGGGMDFTWGASGNFNALAPSAVKPVAEAWTNKSWTGLPVYKDTPYNKQDPEWTKAFKNTNTFLVKMCKQLNEWTGGDSVKGGAVDLNPAVMEHLLKGYLGGYMQTANQSGKLGETVFGDRKNEFRNWPVVSRFLQEGDERTKWRAVTERYFNLKKEAEETDRQLKRYKRLTELGEDHQADIDELIKTDAYKRMEVYDFFENDIQKIQDVLKRNDLSDEERKQVEGKLNEIRLELLKAVDELGNLTGLGTGRLGAVTGDLLAE